MRYVTFYDLVIKYFVEFDWIENDIIYVFENIDINWGKYGK